jgi:hypothetical protein
MVAAPIRAAGTEDYSSSGERALKAAVAQSGKYFRCAATFLGDREDDVNANAFSSVFMELN